jgi:hypothetical protein
VKYIEKMKLILKLMLRTIKTIKTIRYNNEKNNLHRFTYTQKDDIKMNDNINVDSTIGKTKNDCIHEIIHYDTMHLYIFKIATLLCAFICHGLFPNVSR